MTPISLSRHRLCRRTSADDEVDGNLDAGRKPKWRHDPELPLRMCVLLQTAEDVFHVLEVAWTIVGSRPVP